MLKLRIGLISRRATSPHAKKYKENIWKYFKIPNHSRKIITPKSEISKDFSISQRGRETPLKCRPRPIVPELSPKIEKKKKLKTEKY